MLKKNRGEVRVALLIMFDILVIVWVQINYKIVKNMRESIEILEQNQIEQEEEKGVYRSRCKMLEDLLMENGVLLDSCECN